MVLYVMRFNILPDKVDKYNKWIDNYYRLTLAVRGVVELRGYRTLASSQGHVVVTYEFKNMGTWAKWRSHKEITKFLDELSKLVTNMTFELWGPSPIVPEPIRPENNSVNQD